jgi:hypothetical protein
MITSMKKQFQLFLIKYKKLKISYSWKFVFSKILSRYEVFFGFAVGFFCRCHVGTVYPEADSNRDLL